MLKSFSSITVNEMEPSMIVSETSIDKSSRFLAALVFTLWTKFKASQLRIKVIPFPSNSLHSAIKWHISTAEILNRFQMTHQ